MLELTADQSAILASVIANVVLSVSIQLQKYAKKQIVQLALNGLPSLNFERLWVGGLALLVIAESSFYLSYGIDQSLAMSALGVYTAISNAVLPQLLFESRTHTIVGCFMSMMGILTLVLLPQRTNAKDAVQWDSATRVIVGLQLVIGIVQTLLRSYGPANCSLRMTANCGLSAFMGSHCVSLIKLVYVYVVKDGGQCSGSTSSDFVAYICKSVALLLSIALMCFLFQVMLLIESLHFFPVWQVVPHHFAIFSAAQFWNNWLIFGEYNEQSSLAISAAILAYLVLIIGVWVSAKPHLDIPATIQYNGLLPELEERLSVLTNSSASSPTATTLTSSEYQPRLCSDQDLRCMQEEYSRMMHERLQKQEGFRRA